MAGMKECEEERDEMRQSVRVVESTSELELLGAFTKNNEEYSHGQKCQGSNDLR